MCIKIHPRYDIVRKAHLKIWEAVSNVAKEHGITYHELVGILLERAQDVTKYGIRSERHPNDPDKKGDEA